MNHGSGPAEVRDSIVVDPYSDVLFSQFIRSSSPERVSADLIADSTAERIADINNLASPSPSGSGRSSSPYHFLELEVHPPLLKDTGHQGDDVTAQEIVFVVYATSSRQDSPLL